MSIELNAALAGLGVTFSLIDGVTFANEETAKGGDGTGQELTVKVSGIGSVLSVRNTNDIGYASFTCRSSDGHEKFVFAYSNASGTSTFFRGCTFIETWNGTLTGAPPEFFIASDGDPTGGSTFGFYKRVRIKTNGDVSIPHPTASDQADPADAL